MRLLIGLALVGAVAFGALVLGCSQIGRLANRVEPGGVAPISEAARALHASATVVDLHADPLLWGRDLAERSTVGHVDLPRLREGGVALQVFGLVTKFPVTANVERTDPRWPDAITLLAVGQFWPPDTWFRLSRRALYQSARLARLAEESGGAFRQVLSRADLDALLADRTRDPRIVGGLLGIEGAHALEDVPGETGALDELFTAGVRMIGLAHFFDNAFAGSAHGLAKGGLTPRGHALVREMERRGVVLDLAHASPAAIDDALAIATKPMVASHTGVRGTCDNPRNLSDEQIRGIARAGGVIGIGVWETAVCGTAPADVARAIAYVATLVGDAHVGLGTDFDGAVTAGFDASGLPAVTAALLEQGLDAAAIRRILGENALRVLRADLPG